MNSSAREELKAEISATVLKRKKDGVRIIAREGGGTTDWLFDFRAILLQPKWLNLYAELFWDTYGNSLPFQVCGMETAGISLVAAIVMKGVERGTPVNGFFIRKSRKREGLLKFIEGSLTNEPIIFVDDLINSGNTINAASKRLAEANRRVTGAFCLLRFREEKAYDFCKKEGIELTTLFGVDEFSLPLLPANAVEIPKEQYDVLWRFAPPGAGLQHVVPKSAPILDEQHVYFGTDSGVFYALKKSDGAIAWTFTCGRHPDGKGVFSTPVVANGVVYFGAYDGVVYALDARTGREKWRYEKADWIGSSPAISVTNGMLYIGLEFGLFRKQGGIVALALASGAVVWEDRTPALTHGSPQYISEENMVMIGSNDGIAYAYDATNGKPKWTFTTGGAIQESFAYDKKRRIVIFGSRDGRIYFLDCRDGAARYVKELAAGIYSTPLVEGSVVFVTSLDKYVYAIDLESFRDIWEFSTGGRVFASPRIYANSLWIGSNDGRLYELDPKSGALRSSFQMTERIVNAVAYDEATQELFVGSVANELLCIKKKSVQR